jgi:hypothetical protein
MAAGGAVDDGVGRAGALLLLVIGRLLRVVEGGVLLLVLATGESLPLLCLLLPRGKVLLLLLAALVEVVLVTG